MEIGELMLITDLMWEYFYIIDNLGGYYRDRVLIRWNGKWDEEYEVTVLQYIVDGESGK